MSVGCVSAPAVGGHHAQRALRCKGVQGRGERGGALVALGETAELLEGRLRRINERGLMRIL